MPSDAELTQGSNIDPKDSLPPFGRFFLPGPTEVRPEILHAQVRAMMGHRGTGVQDLIADLEEGLRQVFFTERPVIISTSSATGLMEAAVRNAARPEGGKVLSLVNGAFSKRFADIARACALEVDELSVAWGEVHDPGVVREALGGSVYDAVTVVHSETSTGALNDIAALGAVLRDFPDTLLLVDSVTGVGGAEMRADAWGLDFVLTGSQKALALPPGLAFGVASAAMMERAAHAPGKGVYFDLVLFARNLEKHQTPNTPALSLMYALQAQLRRIGEETMEGRWRRHREMARRTWEWVGEMKEEGMALEVLAPEGRRSPTVTCIALPEGLAGPAVVQGMARRGWVIGGGYGKLKPTHIRIGHMGDHTPEELEDLLAVLAEVIQEEVGR
ncbi:MAG: pyridoxal-phosphate-dependent aminotransferase family protein [Gemmatimonadota bacterium]